MARYIMVMRHTKYWLVGPFDTREALVAWGEDPANNPTDDPRWQSIELTSDDIFAPPLVMTPEFASAQVKEGEWV